MDGSSVTRTFPEPHQPATCFDERQRRPFAQATVTITQQDYIELRHRASYWEAQYARAKSQLEALKQEIILKDAKIKDLQNRLFGRKSEKNNPLKSEKNNTANSLSNRHRGQQPGSRGHGRTDRANLPIVHQESDLPNEKKVCSLCGLPYPRNAALDETSDLIEVKVRAHLRRLHRHAYTRHPNGHCDNTPAILTAQPPPRVIPRSDYDVSFWVEVILSKYRYGQPTHQLSAGSERSGTAGLSRNSRRWLAGPRAPV
ncbi:MAG: transposase [Gammaproteobacteria bacterium]